MSEQVRIMPMYNPVPIWDKGSESQYPDALKMAFRDGQTRTYRLVIEQPAPTTFTERAARILEDNCFGGYKAKHAKK